MSTRAPVARRLTRRLTLRARMALLTAAAVALAVAACASAGWLLTRNQLYRELDRRLGAVSGGPPGARDGYRDGQPPFHGPRLPRRPEAILAACPSEPTGTGAQNPPPGPYEIMQLVRADGRRCTVPGAGALKVTAEDVQVARGERDHAYHDGTGVTASGTEDDVRILTRSFRLPDGTPAAVSYAISLDEVQGPLDNLALLLTAVTALGVLVSAAAGLMIARASLRPVDELTGAVEHIARTEDLDTRIPEEGTDEIARLSRSFNTMTAALAASRERQQQLIADAGHELRTPSPACAPTSTCCCAPRPPAATCPRRPAATCWPASGRRCGNCPASSATCWSSPGPPTPRPSARPSPCTRSSTAPSNAPACAAPASPSPATPGPGTSTATPPHWNAPSSTSWTTP